jgi:hypothetical protein
MKKRKKGKKKQTEKKKPDLRKKLRILFYMMFKGSPGWDRRIMRI